MSGESIPAVVELKIPAKPEFVGIARLTILGVASRMQFTYDEVEDVRLAVGEACTTAVERSIKANIADTDITIRSDIAGNRLTIQIMDSISRAPDTTEKDESIDDIDEQNLGALLMELLVDEFSVEQIPDGGTPVTLVKYAG